jgi:hypothetical protein
VFSNLPAQNMALYLDGDGDYVSLPNIIVNSPTFTIEAWALMEGVGGGIRTSNPIFQQRDDIPGDYRSAIILFAERYIPNQNTTFWVRSDNNIADVLEFPNPGYGEWHHYAGVVTPDWIYLFLDGVLVDSTLNSQTGSYTTSIDYIDIGRHRYNQGDRGFFYGYIDEIRIWNIDRSQSEIVSNMALTLSGTESNLIAYWNFQDGTADDVTLNGHNGMLIGDATITSIELPALCQLMGDVNSDSTIDIYDVLIVVDFILGRETDTINSFCADCNQDSNINILDIICILHLIFD